MQNPFNHENYSSNELKRNTFPCSFQNNLTMKYGYIYPAGIWRTVPGATYKIKPTLGLNFMPTTFPIQTRQKVYVHYFYGRDRNFWKDYKDFVNGQRPDLVKPYIDESVTQARTGKLLDYLGVPTTIVGNYANYVTKPFELEFSNSGGLKLPYAVDPNFSNYAYVNTGRFHLPLSPSLNFDELDGGFTVYESPQIPNSLLNFTSPLPNAISSASTVLAFPLNVDNIDVEELRVPIVFSESLGMPVNDYLSQTWSDLWSASAYGSDIFGSIKDMYIVGLYDSNDNLLSYLSYPELSNQGELRFTSSVKILGVSKIVVYCPIEVSIQPNVDPKLTFTVYDKTNSTLFCYPTGVTFQESVSGTSVIRDIDADTSPYWRSGTTDFRERIKLNAYLPRFYETVYNLYYRNPQNNPYILDGRPEYNKFIPSKDGGLDSNLYELRRRNWEDDFLTTAVQSPQQGIAPLVGLTDRGATLTLTNDDGTVTRYNVTTTDDGSISGIEANDTNAEPVLTKALIDAVSYGISIEDIRNVNAMQKWLELNLRKGYQYKDIIQARWGISISYNELDLPEFIGGFTKDVQLQAVTQTANVSDDVTGQLGWQAGRLFASGEGREITHYCDEEGYIMCLITVVPVPNYSQLLPKHWFERDLLDSYQPEFNHIGFQPITYKEVCPIQSFQESTENVNVLEQTFGYQRPWYQYFNYTDEVHGQFRTTFKDFLINRVFDVKPELSESFLLVDPEQINDVFNVPDAEDDKIIGAIYHNCVAKLPISLYAQARLE